MYNDNNTIIMLLYFYSSVIILNKYIYPYILYFNLNIIIFKSKYNMSGFFEMSKI